MNTNTKQENKYNTRKEGDIYLCDCKHEQINHNQDCRHIQQLRNTYLMKEMDVILEHIRDKRDERDYNCDTMHDVIESNHRKELPRLLDITLTIACNHGTVTSDDLHTVTNETYRNDRIVGVVFAVLLRQGLLEQIGYRSTSRKCAHGRRIGVYQLKKKEEAESVVKPSVMVPKPIWEPLVSSIPKQTILFEG